MLAALAVLRAAGYRSIRVIGAGVSSLFTAFGCCAGPELWESIELEEAPASMRTLVRKAIYREPQSFAPRGMLRHFDLAEVYAELAVGHKSQDPVGRARRPLPIVTGRGVPQPAGGGKR